MLVMYMQCFIKSHINQNTLETTGADIRKNSGPVVEVMKLRPASATDLSCEFDQLSVS